MLPLESPRAWDLLVPYVLTQILSYSRFPIVRGTLKCNSGKVGHAVEFKCERPHFFLSVFQDFLEKQIHISLKNEDNKQSTIVSAKTAIVSLDIHSFSLYGEINIKLDYASL